jgi:hypothetical protein
MNTVQFHLIRNKLSVGDRVLWLEEICDPENGPSPDDLVEATGTVKGIHPESNATPLAVERDDNGETEWLAWQWRIKIVSHS